MNKPIRILQVGMSPYYGGTEAFIMNLYKHIDYSKVQFDFLNVYNEAISCQDEIIKLGGRILDLKLERRKGLIKYYKEINKFFKENREISGIHCHFQSLINIDLLLFAKLYRVPIRIVHAHNSGFGKKPNIFMQVIILFNKYIIKYLATDFFACSKLAAKWMFNKNQVQIIHNAIESDKFIFNNKTRLNIRRRLKIDNKIVVGHVGRFDPQKNPLFLLDIFAELVKKNKDYFLVMVGDGILRENIENKISELNIEKNVLLLGSRRNVNEIMQAMDIFLFPSLFEGLGIVLIEAQAAALKCFASRDVIPEDAKISPLLEFISLKENAEQWANYILDIEVPYVRQDMTRNLIEAKYDMKLISKEVQNFYLKSEKGKE